MILLLAMTNLSDVTMNISNEPFESNKKYNISFYIKSGGIPSFFILAKKNFNC